MRDFIHSLLRFIKGSIHYRIRHRGLGEFSRDAEIIPIYTYKFDAIKGRGRVPETEQAKLVALTQGRR